MLSCQTQTRSSLCTLLLIVLSVIILTVPNQVSAQGQYLLGVDDEIEVTVRNHDTLNRSVIVRPYGKISFPAAGELQAAGLTAPQLATAIQKRLDRTLNNAKVLVLVKTVRSRRARVLGAVTKPGVYDIKPGWRVMDLVAVAEGLTTKPIRIQGRVVRGGNALPFSVERAVSEPQGKENVALQADDLVMLEATDIRNAIHVVGQAARPGAYDLEEGLTPVGLVAKAGGVTSAAALRRVHVLRGSAQIPLNLEATLVEGRNDPAVQNFVFLPGDVLVIPENTLRAGIMGQVVRPAYYALPEKVEDASVLKMLALAGGQLPDADLKNATITRTENGVAQVIPIDVAALLSGIAPDTVRLRPDDVLHLPKQFNQVHVIGQVQKPGVYDLKNGLNLLSLLSEAGNPTTGARLSGTYVLRDGKQIPMNLHAAYNGNMNDPVIATFALQPGDVIVIPENQMRFGVMGQVTRPGFYPFPETGKVTVLEALGTAGGQIPQGDQRGNLRETGLIRTVNGKPAVIKINIEEILTKGKVQQNIELQPNDVIYVPAKGNSVKWTDILGSIAGLGFLF